MLGVQTLVCNSTIELMTFPHSLEIYGNTVRTQTPAHMSTRNQEGCTLFSGRFPTLQIISQVSIPIPSMSGIFAYICIFAFFQGECNNK